MSSQQPSGMVVAQVVDLGHQLGIRADQLELLARQIAGRLQHVYWHGQKADRFRADLVDLLPALTHVASALRGLSQRAAANAADQERTSQSDSGSAGGFGGGWTTMPYRLTGPLGGLLGSLGGDWWSTLIGPPMLPGVFGPHLLDELRRELSSGGDLGFLVDTWHEWIDGGGAILGQIGVLLLDDGVIAASEKVGLAGALVGLAKFEWDAVHDGATQEVYAEGGALATGLAVGLLVGGPIGAVVGFGAGIAYTELEKHYPGFTENAFMTVGNGYLDLVHTGATGVENGINAVVSGAHAVGRGVQDVEHAAGGIISGGINKIKSIF